MKRNAGFTLMELLIVVLIIVVLASALIPGVAILIRNSRKVICERQLGSIKDWVTGATHFSGDRRVKDGIIVGGTDGTAVPQGMGNGLLPTDTERFWRSVCRTAQSNTPMRLPFENGYGVPGSPADVIYALWVPPISGYTPRDLMGSGAMFWNFELQRSRNPNRPLIADVLLGDNYLNGRSTEDGTQNEFSSTSEVAEAHGSYGHVLTYDFAVIAVQPKLPENLNELDWED